MNQISQKTDKKLFKNLLVSLTNLYRTIIRVFLIKESFLNEIEALMKEKTGAVGDVEHTYHLNRWTALNLMSQIHNNTLDMNNIKLIGGKFPVFERIQFSFPISNEKK